MKVSLKLCALASFLLLSSCATAPTPSTANARVALYDPHHAFWSQKAPELFHARFETSVGNYVLEVHRDWAPRGVDRLYNLIRAGFFDDSRFYRVDANYIVQYGIAGKPEVAKIWRNEAIPDDAPKQSNVRGTIGYAALAAPNTRTTQVYINLADNSRNDSQGVVPFGKVISGMDVVDKIYSGYGENSGGGMRAGKQDRLFEEGNAWLDKDFPRITHLIRATILVSVEDVK